MLTPFENKYNALHSIIDFFSQNLHLEQIVEYGFNIYNQLELPLASAIFTLNDDKSAYEAKFFYGDILAPDPIVKAAQHDAFAVRNGFFTLDKNIQTRYFKPETLLASDVQSIMPLIIDDQLFGFIFTKHISPETHLGEGFISRFNFLMNLALEKASRYLEREQLRVQIDKGIFSLNTLSHTMRLLLSELSTTHLLDLSLDVIREISTSSVTAIGLLDETDGLVKTQRFIKGTERLEAYETFKLVQDAAIPNKNIFHLPEDLGRLATYFENPMSFFNYQATHVILIRKPHVIGFITLGEPMTMTTYDRITLERIRDVASIMSIGLINAKQFEMINHQKEQLRLSLGVFKSMNRLIKSINASENLNELLEHIEEAARLTFGVEKGAIVLLKPKPHMICIPNTEKSDCDIQYLLDAFASCNESFVASYTVAETALLLGKALVDVFKPFNCFILAPIKIDQIHAEPIGFLLVTQTKKRLHESQVTMIEMLSNSVAPMIQSLQNIEQLKNDTIPNPVIRLKQMVEKHQEEWGLYELPYWVYFKYLPQSLFESPDIKAYEGYETVHFQGLLIVFSQTPLEGHLYDFELPIENPTYEAIVAFAEKKDGQ